MPELQVRLSLPPSIESKNSSIYQPPDLSKSTLLGRLAIAGGSLGFGALVVTASAWRWCFKAIFKAIGFSIYDCVASFDICYEYSDISRSISTLGRLRNSTISPICSGEDCLSIRSS